ncbi:hypothetical protein K0M31_013689 [Melipona bicolor]|uniref:Uncharacterized protein n=1 Tax=Melipona bicolor TaxID=60889 RepID=A0AA40KGE2_9HYME|nr:hypothetical protein K0M31_013689 [Melipona bicolor]
MWLVPVLISGMVSEEARVPRGTRCNEQLAKEPVPEFPRESTKFHACRRAVAISAAIKRSSYLRKKKDEGAREETQKEKCVWHPATGVTLVGPTRGRTFPDSESSSYLVKKKGGNIS